MSSRKISLTAQKVAELMARLRAVPAEPGDACLSDDACIGYVMGTASHEEVGQIEAHLASCPDCAREVEHLREGAAAWRGEQGQQRLARVRARVLPAAWRSMQASIADDRRPAEYVPVVVHTPDREGSGNAPQALGTIPALLLREDQTTKSVVMVTRKPVVSPDGRLRMRIRVRQEDFAPGEQLELTLIAVPEGKTIGASVTFDPTKAPLLAFDLPPEVQREWQDIEHRAWADLPLHVVLCPAGAPDKGKDGV